jgi:hypothetical protein
MVMLVGMGGILSSEVCYDRATTLQSHFIAGRHQEWEFHPMKVHVEVECTPEEARRFMGLPDVEKANAAYVDGIAKAMKGVSNVDQLQEFAKQLAPMGQVGLKMFQNFMDSGNAFAEGAGARSRKPDDDFSDEEE